ncbi:MAG: SusC/RagA family TonB-linked outer membrane protein [Flammeovirgaceae bacterium]|nr:SusC/RagA family TonB-linked outer membrane protein [Flammeovirgaceae bacterium]
MKKFLLLCSMLVFVYSYAMAQERTVSGRVTSAEDGSSLPGVNVVVKGSTIGTVTDADGNYKLSVPSTGGALVFSFIGLKTSEVEIGERSVVDIALSLDVTQLSEVVVTAQGIARDKKALGYAVSSVGENQIASRPQNDLGRILQGKVPGVNITPTGGTSGTATNIQIRGYSSVSGNTQPLFVVDGVPFNSATNNGSGFTTGGAATATSRFLDLDPNNIETINILKGLAATVTYGDQGRNGVVLITTKSGRGKSRATEITVQQNFSVTEIASLPKFQSKWGNGFQGLAGPFFSNWGPEFSEIDSLGHPYQFSSDAALLNAYPEYFFQRIPYEAAPTIKDFFRKGVTSNTSVNFNGGNDKVGFNGSVGYSDEEGFVPGNDVKRLNIGTGINAAISKKLTFKSSFLFARTEVATPPLNAATGGGATLGGVPSLYGQFLYTPRDVNIFEWPFATPNGERSIFYRGGNDIVNPLWASKNYLEGSVTNRVFNSSSFSYDFNEMFSFTYQFGLDHYTEAQERRYNRGGVQGPNVINGVFQTQNITNTIINHDFRVNFSKEINSDINVVGLVGFNAPNDQFLRDGLYSEGQGVFGLFRHFNFSTASSRSVAFGGRILNTTSEEQRMGIYASAQVDFKDYLFVTLAGRKDWTSTLEQANNTIFYPSANIAFVPTDAFTNLKSSTLNYLKLRFGYGTSAGFAPRTYGTRTFALGNSRDYLDLTGSPIGSNEVSNFLGNPSLRPELQREFEVGFEAKLFNDRINIDFSAFNRTTKNLITDTPLDPSTGYNLTFTNVGALENRGIELGITGQPLRYKEFTWDATLNLTILRPEVTDLGSALENVLIDGLTTRGNFAIAGLPYGVIMGTAALRSPSGERVVRNSDGLYAVDPILRVIGNPNPDWTSSLINTFSYKGISLMVQIDYRQGGDMYASTPSATLGRGVVEEGNNPLDQAYILPGVRQVPIANDNDGVADGYIKNDIAITASDYGFNTQFNGIDETAIFDGTNIRLREIAISYQLPKAWLAKTPIKSASIQINGNNLWFNAVNVPKNVNFDPEVLSTGVGNGNGFDYLTGPSARRYGVALRVTF